MRVGQVFVLGVAVVLCGAVMAGVAGAAPVTERVSVTDYGGAANGPSWGVGLSSGGGYVTFYSGAGNIVADDDNGSFDVFVRDRLFGTVELISRSSAGDLGNNHSMYPAINTTGQYVAFCSKADNLVAGDTNGFMDVFVRDLDTDLVQLVSVSPTGPANEKSTACAISADGQLVAFQSEATNLLAGETAGCPMG